MTEHQPYDVVAQHPGFELRRYPAHLVAETVINGTFEGAGNKAFGALAGYIGGRNRPGSKVAMTAPVTQEPAAEQVSAERIAMTAPVVQQNADLPGQYVVSFVMPAGSTEESLPEPLDPRVRLRTVGAELAAAHRFSGRWSKASYDAAAARLAEAVSAAGLTVAGPFRFARFNPPWTPWFLRRNEVVVPVSEGPADA
ncbi:hypothetical protein JOE57_001145 [Microlunatus panaciterrae]|uniref:SOUL heme-binding protein n=1 Tax=Microlunatus panaciterrae TaxID=400768 RepID=A0ABS2RGU2_9ACTN|nr:heme-binding protein [Microlunatus panaciterrae]MBM7798224.1 hypothetical protein [Microlunatus panaciterrae]